MAKGKAAKSSGKSSHGGRRAGAGRKPKAAAVARAEFTAAVEREIAGLVPQLVANLTTLANGGYPREEEKYAKNDQGEMVLVERKVSVAEPDRDANKYLLDRLLGRPSPAPVPTEPVADDDFIIDLSDPNA